MNELTANGWTVKEFVLLLFSKTLHNMYNRAGTDVALENVKWAVKEKFPSFPWEISCEVSGCNDAIFHVLDRLYNSTYEEQIAWMHDPEDTARDEKLEALEAEIKATIAQIMELQKQLDELKGE